MRGWTRLLAGVVAALLGGGTVQGQRTEQISASQALGAAGEAVNVAGSIRKGSSRKRPVAPPLWQPVTTYHPLVIDFLKRAKALKLNAPAARLKLANEFGLNLKGLDEALSFLAAMEKGWFNERNKSALTVRALALPQRTDRAPVAIALAAAAISATSDSCSPEQIDALLDGSNDRERDQWLVATNCPSTKTFASLLEKAEASRPAILWLVHGWTNGDPEAELAADEMYLDAAMTGVIDPAARAQLVASVIRDKLSKHYAMGMFSEALAFADRLDPAALELALHLPAAEVRTQIAGFPFYLEANRSFDHFATEHAAALALAGRRDQALRLLDSIAEPQRRSKARACLDAVGERCLGDYSDPLTSDVLVIDQFLRDPGADPYVLLEARAGNHSSASTLVDEILCRLVTGPDKTKVCNDAHEEARSNRSGDDRSIADEDRTLWHAIGKAFGPRYAEASDRYKTVIARYGTKPRQSSRRWDRASVDPHPAPFQEVPLPSSASGQRHRPAPVPKGTAPLPAGFTMVRFERHGDSAAAISVSPLLDPNGEVSAGGYWLHLSNDGGKHWLAPLYTGLAEYFPYVVPSSSRLPMLAGNHIHLEVVEALIDTASISYPPVGTRTKRRRSGIYLDIPVADLKRDSDDDGISDIAAHHLLLDRPDADKPFIVGRDRNCTGTSSETTARLAILKQMYKVEANALIEPVDRPAEAFGLWRRQDVTAKPPIFLEGDADDYRCVSVDRPMIVYRAEDRDLLRRFSPDFQLVSLPPITWNRAHTRGFVKWSMGWTGGTFRLVKSGDGWTMTSISSWIT
jgi:hypothetical protein